MTFSYGATGLPTVSGLIILSANVTNYTLPTYVNFTFSATTASYT
jgi:hypothetical protein